MGSDWVVTVWIFARVQQQSNNLDMPKARCHGQIHSSAAPHPGLHCLKFAVQSRCVYSAVGIRAVIAQEID